MKKTLLFTCAWILVVSSGQVVRARNGGQISGTMNGTHENVNVQAEVEKLEKEKALDLLVKEQLAADKSENEATPLAQTLGQLEALSLTYDEIVYDTPYTFYLNKDKTIKYATYDETGIPERYYTYYRDTRLEDDYMKRVQQVVYVDEVGVIQYTEEREDLSDTVRAYYEYYPGTVYDANYKKHIKRRFWTSKDGNIFAEPYADLTGRIKDFDVYEMGTPFSYPIDEKKIEKSFVYQGTDLAVYYYKNGDWTEVMEYDTGVEGWQTKYRYYMQPNTANGLLAYGVKYRDDAEYVADTYYQYYDGATYDNHWDKVHFTAVMNADRTINHARHYDENGYWIKAFTFPAGTKINHKIQYWEGRTQTFYMKPNRKDGLLTHSVVWNSAGGMKAMYWYASGAFYGKGHDGQIIKVSYY